MLLVALASCSSVDVVEILEKKRKKLSLLEVIATGEQDPEPPWTYRKIHVKYRLGGEGLTPKAVEQAISLSQDKYCSVAATIRGVAQITTEYEIVA
jgi:putative redox protein